MFSSYAWYHALLGGALIGAGSWLAMLASGRIPGISGLFSRVLLARGGDTAWRAVFFAGLLLGAGLVFFALGSVLGYRPVQSKVALILAGLLVGYGTRLGGGCTSGHGVCGIGMGSRTALIATALFMAAAIATVALLRHTPLGEVFR